MTDMQRCAMSLMPCVRMSYKFCKIATTFLGIRTREQTNGLI